MFIEERILVPPRWRSGISVVRLVLALGGVLLVWLGGPPYSPAIGVALAAYLSYAVAVTWWERLVKPSQSLSGFAADVLFCAALAAVQADGAIVVCLLAFTFLLATAMLLHRPATLVAGAGIVIAVAVVMQPAEAARMATAMGMAAMLALAGGLHRQTLVRRLLVSSQQAVVFRTESERARQAEREKISGDFHDGPLQSFVSFQLKLEVIRTLLERKAPTVMEELVRLQELTRSQIQEMREFVRNLRPVEVDETGLEATVGRLVKTFERESGIQARFRGNGTSEIEDPEKSREVLKIIREGLHNAHKHSGASQVSVGLARSNGALEILIQDDGTGFPFAGRYSMEELDSLGLGPESIKRRVRALHGDMSVDSRPGMGADVRVLIPA